MKLKAIITGFFLLLMVSVGGVAAQKPAPNDETELRKVVENFRISLINKDKPLFLGLFLEGMIGWQSVTADKSLLQVKEKQPKAVKVVVNPKDNHLSFIDFIVGTEKRTEETFSEIRIKTDGDIALVSFDYAFLYDSRETNHGQEYWLLVRTENGWKITSVVWSETLPPLGQPK